MYSNNVAKQPSQVLLCTILAHQIQNYNNSYILMHNYGWSDHVSENYADVIENSLGTLIDVLRSEANSLPVC